jgi:HAD superfamily hydrolase (TIGR01549 family)
MWEVKMLRAVRAIVFDLDNTLVSSHIDYGRLKLAVLEELTEAGVPDQLLDEKASVVENFIRGMDFLKKNSGASKLMEFNRELDRILTQIEMERVEQVREIEGAQSLVHSLKENGLEVGILTRGSRAYATTVLGRTGFNGQIVHLVCRDDYPMEEAKPNPLAMDRIAEKLHCRPEDCLFIGDHPLDLECAKASGAAFIGVLTGSTNREKWRQTGCEVVINSIADLPRLLIE